MVSNELCDQKVYLFEVVIVIKMANPFSAQFDSTCDSCGDPIMEGDEIFATPEGFVCPDCAEEGGYVCECGNFKKPEYEECYDCFNENKEEDGETDTISDQS